MARQATRFTIYDMMEAKGVFDTNPANAQARDADGNSLYVRQLYPVMLYHPKGEERVVEPERLEPTPTGPVRIPPRFELIWRVAADAGEEAKLLELGWHKTPGQARVAAGHEAPPSSVGDQLEEMKAKIAQLEKEKQELEAQRPKVNTDLPAAAQTLVSGPVVPETTPRNPLTPRTPR